jgi:N-acetylneuraminic acid mutarotase
MLVFGGYGGGFPGGYLNDVWSYDPAVNGWTQLAIDQPSPPARARHSAVWDAARQRMLVLGGFAGGIDYLADLWAYEPRQDSWSRLGPGGPQMGARSAHAAVWDTARSQMILWGGYGGALYDELWTYAP